MDYPIIDQRSEEMLLAEIKERAAACVPEWRFDPAHPDAGGALALMFARMQHRTLGSYNKLLWKLQTDFFNRIGADMRAGVAAEGYAVFSLVNGAASGMYLKKGVRLTSDADAKNGEKVGAETLDDVYVTQTNVRAVYACKRQPDSITKLYDSEAEEQKGFSLFDGAGENLSAHVCDIAHPSLLSFGKTGELGLILKGADGGMLSEALLGRLAEGAASFSYATEAGFEALSVKRVADGVLYLEKGALQPPAARLEQSGIDSYWLRMQLLDGALCEQLALTDLRLCARGTAMEPDCVQTEGNEQSKALCLPFGEQFSVYNEVYFASKEALSKRGAWISFSFREGFVNVPIGGRDSADIQWKLVMPHAAVPVSKAYDITIEEVIWEYFNGYGWARLFAGSEYSRIFGTDEGTAERRHTLVFRCPEDIAPAYVGAAETYYIRARIRKVNNAFRTEGQYIAPVISQLRFQYEYPKEGLRPSHFLCRSNMEEKLFMPERCFQGLYPWHPFWRLRAADEGVYFGFSERIAEGPIRMLFELEDTALSERPRLRWSYGLGGGRFQDLNPSDGTEHFRQTGIVTFAGNADWAAETRFGRQLYWLRVCEAERHDADADVKSPFVKQFWLNAARIRAVRSGFEEHLSFARYEEHAAYPLLYGGLCDVAVWVNETETLSREDEERLSQAGRLRRTTDFSGMVEALWTKWEQVGSFSASEAGDRHYVLDANAGVLHFGDNRNGRIPPVGVADGIFVRYSIGGGDETNLPAHGITGLESSIGFINQASNPLPLSGGYEREQAEDAMRRRAGELRHRFRAVSLRDYELLAMEVCGGLAAVRCVSGFDEKGRKAAGHVSLLVLQRDYQDGGAAQFAALAKRIQSYLAEHADPFLSAQHRLHVLKPVFVAISVQCEISIRGHEEAYEVRAALVKRLEHFLDPLCGGLGGRGFSIGTLPEHAQLLDVIYNDARIVSAQKLLVSCERADMAKGKEVSLEDLVWSPYLLAVSGTHRIRVDVM